MGTGQEGQGSIPCRWFLMGNGDVNAQPCGVAGRDVGVVIPM